MGLDRFFTDEFLMNYSNSVQIFLVNEVIYYSFTKARIALLFIISHGRYFYLFLCNCVGS